MTGRERILNCLDHKGVDRVPVSPFIWENFVREFYQSYDVDLIEGTVKVYDHFGFDIIHRTCTPCLYLEYERQLESKNWKPLVTVEQKGKSRFERTVIKTPQGELTQVIQFERASEYEVLVFYKEYFIKTEDDLDKFIKYQPPIPDFNTELIKKAQEMVGNKGITAPWVQGVFNYLGVYLRRVDDLIMDAMVNRPFYEKLMNYSLKRNLAHIMRIIKAKPDALSYGGNLAGGDLGPKFFIENVFEYEKELISQIQSKGVRVIYHNCGNATSLFDVYPKLGMSAYESLTSFPYGDTDLKQAKRKLSQYMTLMGNIDQIDFLRKASPEQVQQRVREVMEIAKPGGNFILSTSDYFNENTPHENIFTLLEAGREFGEY